MQSELKVYGRLASINVRKVLWCCEELALSYVREDWGIGFKPTDSEKFLRINPNGLVPAIDDGGFMLWQSNSIIRYLANAYGPALYPLGARERAAIDQWIDWQATELNDAWRYAFMSLVRKSPAYQDEELVAQSIAQWSKMMSILDRQLEATDAFVAGRAFTLADIPVGLSVHRWFSTPIQRPALPAVASYYDRLKARSGFVAQIGEA